MKAPRSTLRPASSVTVYVGHEFNLHAPAQNLVQRGIPPLYRRVGSLGDVLSVGDGEAGPVTHDPDSGAAGHADLVTQAPDLLHGLSGNKCGQQQGHGQRHQTPEELREFAIP